MKFSSKLAVFKVIILTSGISLALVTLPRFESRFLFSTFIIFLAILTVRALDIRLPDGEKAKLDSSYSITALLLLPLANALAAILAATLAWDLYQQKRVDLGGPLYNLSRATIVALSSGMWLSSQYLLPHKPGFSINFTSGQIVLVFFAGLTYFLMDLLLREVERSLRKKLPTIPLLSGSIRFFAPIYLSAIPVGVLTAIMFEPMSYYSLVIFALPLVIVHYSFVLLLDIKGTYKNTIIALTRAVELGEPNQLSHGERVAQLAVDMARELGYNSRRLESISFAALLHDIGKIGSEKEETGELKEEDVVTEQDPPHAVSGANILRQVNFLRPYAHVVAKHHLIYNPNGFTEWQHPMDARLIAVANYYDCLTTTKIVDQRLTPNQALAKIKKRAGDLDPKAIRCLASVLKKQEKIIDVRG